MLKDIEMEVLPGKTTALVGASGSGKSTLTAMLYQFYQPQSGEILLGNNPINQLNLHHYRSQMALVPQEVTLFGGSIYENIRYGKPDASDQAIREAAKDAFALDFIESFPRWFRYFSGRYRNEIIRRTKAKNCHSPCHSARSEIAYTR